MLREPVPTDAPALGRLHAETWHAAYAGLVPARVLAQATAERRTAFWRQILGGQALDRRTILVAGNESTGALIGFAIAGPGRGEDGDPAVAAELYAIYVDQSHWGSGAGHELLIGIHEALRASGFSEAALWVLSGNDRACRFYERHGWRTDGVEVVRDVEDNPVPELRYRRSLLGG